MAYGNAFDSRNGEKVAHKIAERVDEIRREGDYDASGWRQDQWNAVTKEAIFDLRDELDGDDIKDLIAYATEDCDGWEIMEISLDSALGSAIWCLWEDGDY